MPTVVRSHAKINLGLYIGAPRADGFHSLVTVYQTLELHDLVTVSARLAAETTIRLTSNDKRVPTDERNTAWKAVGSALQDGSTDAEVEIHIEKRLPIQGGLGAGSANAIAALLGLERELGWNTTELWPELKSKWRNRIKDPEVKEYLQSRDREMNRYWQSRRLGIAADVGSDVPLFLIGGAVLGLDRGQEVYPLPDLEPMWCVVATPDVAVSTPQAFRDWDALCAEEGLTQEASAGKLKQLSHAYASAFAGAGVSRAGSSGVVPSGDDFAGPQGSALIRTGITSWIENDFERVVFRQHPSLAEIKRILAAAETPEAALYASLSGSGSALYGLYLTRGDAEKAQLRLQRTSVRSQVTRTLSRKAYWAQMMQDFEP